VQIVLNPVDENMEYVNPQIKSNELYLGLSFSNQIQKNNNNENCMFLLAGATGSGKTRYIYQVLLSWILNCSPNEVQIYLSDIAKNEYIQFKNVKHIKYYAAELEELESMMRIVSKEYERRKRLISGYREKGMATNISEYNKLIKTNKLPYCYVVIDEFSILLPDKTDSKEEKKIKEFILDTLKRLSKLGRSLGMFTFIATQKTTREEMPSILKNMSAVRISFRANDLISSEVIMGNNSATGLPPRVAVYSLNGGTTTEYLYAPKLTINKLKELLGPHIENKTTNYPKKNTSQNNDVTVISTKVTRVPKGVDIKEYLESLKKVKEDDFIDY
jgi:DNA segregation ATPase FtsK/SpoIIIE-like protein